MKNIKHSISILFFAILLSGCTEEFERFDNENQDITSEFISARFFFPSVQTQLWMPASWNYFFTRMQYGSTYGGYASFGHKNSWESPDVTFNTGRSWGAAANAWNWFSSYTGTLAGFTDLVKPGGDFENPLMEAVGKIMKSSYYAIYTDLWGEVPYSEVGVAGVLTPKFDTQADIYQGIIADLNAAMIAIGSETVTGAGTDDLGAYDIMFNGDLQKWKTYANGLKLRLALRAKGAPGASFADEAIIEALASPLPTEDAKIKKDVTVDRSIADRDGFYERYGLSPAKMLSSRFINILQDNNDPRLSAYAEPIPGGEVVFAGYNSNGATKTKVDYLLANTLDRAGVSYTSTSSGDDLIVTIEAGTHYVGMPMRFVDSYKTLLDTNLFSRLSSSLEDHNQIGVERDQMVMPLAEVYFMQAEAAVLGFGGDAQLLMQSAIQASFDDWGVSDNGYLSTAMATLSGSKEEQLQTLGLQAWIAYYHVDYQGFAIARDFKLEGITDDIPNDSELFSLNIDLGTKFPQRVKYAQPAYDLNGANVEAANGRQGPDTNATELWFAKGIK